MANIPAPKEQTVLPEGQLPYASVRSSPEDFGAGLGAATQQAGDVASQIALRDQAIKNETARVNAENDLMARAQDLQNGNKDAGITGYRTLLGQQAVDALPDYQQKLQDAYKEVRSGLNPAVQRQFDSTAFRIVRGTTDSMGAYGAQQQVVGYHQAARARVGLAQQGALTYADDPDGWATHIADVQEASMAGSHSLGLGPDETEMQRRRDISDVYVERTKQLSTRSPIEAKHFYDTNIGSIVPDQRYELDRMLNTTTNAQLSRKDGTDAYHEAIGQPSAAAVPTDLKAPNERPFDQARLDSVSKFVKTASPLDPLIESAAKTYNVSPNEIKLKIAIESGGNPTAVNPKSGATGLGQFMAGTATQYGVTDRTDPAQSINGIAKFLAAHGGTTGSDMKGADKAYNGTGPDADQYVENTRAARQAAFGGGAPAPMTTADLESKEADVISQAQAVAERRRPGDNVYRDQVVSEARSAWSKDVQALRGQDYANMSKVLDVAVHGGATSISDLPPDIQQTLAKLPPRDYQGVQAQLERNVRAANGEFTKSDPVLVNSLRQRIYLPDGDPQRLTSPAQLTQYIASGLNYTDTQRLRTEMAEANTPEGNPFLKRVNGVKESARKMLIANAFTNASMHPELAEEAAYRFGTDLDDKIKAARAAKKDPTSLFTPGSPDYVLDPARVMAFNPSEADVVAQRARGPAPVAAPPVPPKPVVKRLPGESPADYLKRVGAA